MQEIHSFVSGRVQFVMFRDFVKRNARRLDLTGWVTNLSDGRVEFVAQGKSEDLEALLVQVHKGSLLSRVDNVATTWCPPTQRYEKFVIKEALF